MLITYLPSTEELNLGLDLASSRQLKIWINDKNLFDDSLEEKYPPLA